MAAMYRFLPNRKAAHGGAPREAALALQAAKVLEEACEVSRAIRDDEGGARILEECADVIQAVEGVQRMFDRQAVECSYQVVRRKCRDRGDYETERGNDGEDGR